MAISNKQKNRPLRVFTWHVHGSYLYYLSLCNIDIYLPFKNDKTPGYGGKTASFSWGSNVHEVPVEEVKDLELDCILFQSQRNYFQDQFDILSEEQRMLPKVYLEHDPPRETPTDTKHWVSDKETSIVHVTHFNNLMWNNGDNPTYVIDHGVTVPQEVSYNGLLEKGIVVVNCIESRGRRLGYDIFEKVRKEIPLDIVGMESDKVGGLGEISHNRLPRFLSYYRFYFSPIRYTSLGLSTLEAMMTGLPVVGVGTAELATVIKNHENGYIDTNVDALVYFMKYLLKSPQAAKKLGANAKKTASERFNIQRFSMDWETVFRNVIKEHSKRSEHETSVNRYFFQTA